ncbi:MASE1 domain-containing protein [Enterobacteriaceae bacterium C23F]
MRVDVLNTRQRAWVLTLPGWGVLYYVLGYLSLTLDDPGSRIAFIWLPAGVAVSAFLTSPRASWIWLFITLFIARLLLDITFHHVIAVSLGTAFISLLNDGVIAWIVRRFSRGRDDLNKVVTWIAATLLVSAVGAVAGVSWLSLLNGTPWLKGLWIWWSANVTGTLFVTPALVGLVSAQIPQRTVPLALSLLLLLAVLISTLLIFARTPDNHQNIALTYTLACLPLILMMVTAVVCNARLGSIAFIAFSAVVVSASWHETGPFYLARLSTEESIILAQCYLSGAALLIVFIRAQKSVGKTDRRSGASQDIAYTLNPENGQIVWNPHACSPLSAELTAITSREGLLEHIPDEAQKAQLQRRWQSALEANAVEERFPFMLHLAGRRPVAMAEITTLPVVGAGSTVIVGFWVEEHSGLLHAASKGEG